MTRASTAATSPTMVARPIANAHALRDLAQRSWHRRRSCPIRAQIGVPAGVSAGQDAIIAGLLKRSADPTLVRPRHLPLLPARGSRRDQDHPVRSNAEAQSPAGGCSAGTTLPISGCLAPSRKGTEHSEARPVPTRQNSRFWMSATSRTITAAAALNWLRTGGRGGHPGRAGRRAARGHP